MYLRSDKRRAGESQSYFTSKNRKTARRLNQKGFKAVINIEAKDLFSSLNHDILARFVSAGCTRNRFKTISIACANMKNQFTNSRDAASVQ
jgi:hypothetical protein